jgi:hypothetical protein
MLFAAAPDLRVLWCPGVLSLVFHASLHVALYTGLVLSPTPGLDSPLPGVAEETPRWKGAKEIYFSAKEGNLGGL